MRLPSRAVLATVLAAALSAVALAGCSGGDTEALSKEVGDLRAEVQRVQKDNEKLAGQVAAQARRLDGLSEDLNHVRELAMDVKTAPAGRPGAAAARAGDGTASGAPGVPGAAAAAMDAASATPEGLAIRGFLGTEEGKKVLEAAIQADRDARNREQQRRTIDAMVDRFAKLANLTEDQTKKMKDIMGQAAVTRTDMWSSMRDLGPDATPEQRDEARQAAIAKTDELRKQTDDQVKVVLSATQYEQYQQEQDKLRANVRGMGGGGGGAGGRGGRPNGN